MIRSKAPGAGGTTSDFVEQIWKSGHRVLNAMGNRKASGYDVIHGLLFFK